MTPLLAMTSILAFHGTGQGSGGGPLVGVVFVAGIATAVWVLFSKLKWRDTMIVTAVGWALVLGLAFGI